MKIKKNDCFVVDIIDMNESGEGVGKIDGYTLFIKDALIGDKVRVTVVKAKKNYGYARVAEVVRPSEHRVAPRCPVARPCGGCQIQELAYGEQLRFKQRKVQNNLERIGGFTDIQVLPVIGMEEPWRYRNKAQYPVGRDKDGRIVTGFYAGRTHSIVAHEDCLLGQAVNQEILAVVKGYMEEFQVSPYDEAAHRGLVRHVLIRAGYRTGEIMVCLVVNGDKLPNHEVLVERLLQFAGMKSVSLNVNREKGNVILGRKVIDLYGDGFIYDYLKDVKYRISPLSFYQVNPVQTEKLYETALEFAGLTGEETVWDLYCGIGTISLFLARKAKQVFGVEIVEAAIADARENARLNGFENCEFFVGKAEEVLPRLYQERQVYGDVIVVDPPRKGCDEALLRTIVEMGPERVVYVSCDSATLARDLRVLAQAGYEVMRVQLVDMFGHSGHVETVVLLSKLKSAKSIEVKIELDEMDLTTAESKATYMEIK